MEPRPMYSIHGPGSGLESLDDQTPSGCPHNVDIEDATAWRMSTNLESVYFLAEKRAEPPQVLE